MSASDQDMDNEPGSPAAAKLWRQAQAVRGPAAAVSAPDPMTLAAYVDGTLDETGRERVEAWMAGSADALDLIVAARAAQGAPQSPVPAELLARACGLVRGPGIAAPAAGGWLPGWLAAMARPGVWAVACAAMLLAALISFEAGRDVTIHLASAAPLVAGETADEAADFGFPADDLL